MTCNGVTTWCEPACPECTNGQIMWVPTGGCCNDLTEKDKYKCINEPVGVPGHVLQSPAVRSLLG